MRAQMFAEYVLKSVWILLHVPCTSSSVHVVLAHNQIDDSVGRLDGANPVNFPNNRARLARGDHTEWGCSADEGKLSLRAITLCTHPRRTVRVDK